MWNPRHRRQSSRGVVFEDTTVWPLSISVQYKDLQ